MTSSDGGARRPRSKAAVTRAGKAKKAAATRAAARAPRGGADHGKMTRHEKALRDSAIIAAVHAGQSTKQIALEFGIAPRSVQRVVEEFSIAVSPLDRQPMQLVDEIVRIYRRQIADFAKVAAAMSERNPSVSLGAMKAAADALERYTALLARVGKLPANLEVFRGESEMRQISRLMVDAVRRVEDGEMSAFELGEYFDALVRPTSALWDAEAQATELERGSAEDDNSE